MHVSEMDSFRYVEQISTRWKQEKVEGGVKFFYPAPESARGFYPYGFVQKNDSAADLAGWYGLILELTFPQRETKQPALHEKDIVPVCVEAEFADRDPLRYEADLPAETVHRLKEEGCKSLTLDIPLVNFPVETVREDYWQFVTGITVQCVGWEAEVLSLYACRNRCIGVEVPVRGKAGEAGECIIYGGFVYNCTPEPMAVQICQMYEGWETMRARMETEKGSFREPETCVFTIPPFGRKAFQAAVTVPASLVPGGHEETILSVTARDGMKTEVTTVRLETARALPHPYLYHDREGWLGVAEKIRRNPCYQPAYRNYLAAADAWEVHPPLEGKEYCYDTSEETNIMSAAYAFALTGNRTYAHKIAAFFRYFTDEENGYPDRKKGCSQSYVQEGHFFQHLAIPYDMIADAGVLSDTEKAAVEKSFRLYMDMLDMHIRSGEISNWLVSEIMGAFYCALAIQDLERALRFVFGNGGLTEQFRHGMFSDGWWHECSVGYNTWVSSMMIHMAHALLPFGYNLLHTYFPIPCNQEVSSSYPGHQKRVLSGMYNQKWGGFAKNHVCIKDMFDAVVPFLDYRGVLFGIADSDEKKLTGVHFGSTYDLAYYYYKDEAYIPVILQCEPDPIFGNPEIDAGREKRLPLALQGTNVHYQSAHADNIGIVMLRSRKPGREKREQIQAVLRYGSHGGAHGHFDIGDLLSIMRYGRSFFNPEHCWWGYAHFMYKFYVQCSLTKNMVVVDDKMQIPADSRLILFQTSQADSMEAAGVEVRTRWAYPPYGGMVYYQDGQGNSRQALQERCRQNHCYLPICGGEEPVYGEMSEYTEEILQRRVMAVTDDYLVLFDYLEGDGEHVYDSLMQLKGFRGIAGSQVESSQGVRSEEDFSVEWISHTEQMDANPISDAQFITDCNWYRAKGPTKAHSEMIFTQEMSGEQHICDRTNYNEPGILKMDVYTAWPPATEQMVGRVAVYDGWAADGNGYTVPLTYQVMADGEQLAEGAFDGWILGRGEIHENIAGNEELTFTVKQGSSQDELKREIITPQCIFWGSIVLKLDDGSRFDVGEWMKQNGSILKAGEQPEKQVRLENMDFGFGIGRDYKNGRVTIVGTEYENAIPASPLNHAHEGRLTLCLKELLPEGVHAVSLDACIGVDAFAGDEDQKRKTYAVRTRGRTARFVTVIEPYEKEALVREVCADTPDGVTVVLRDGTRQSVTIQGMENGKPVVLFENGYKK
ncbi:MAG: hypothetical protein LIP12_13675 [Clostridiales bacterium]|nr:hypothetical protein [Clostridiales bacterium]